MPGAPLALHRRYDLFRFLNLRSGTRRLNAGGFHALDRIFLLFPAVKRLTDEIRAETAPEREKIRRETCKFFPAASDSQKRKQYREDDADTDAYPAVTPVLALQSRKPLGRLQGILNEVSDGDRADDGEKSPQGEAALTGESERHMAGKKEPVHHEPDDRITEQQAEDHRAPKGIVNAPVHKMLAVIAVEVIGTLVETRLRPRDRSFPAELCTGMFLNPEAVAVAEHPERSFDDAAVADEARKFGNVLQPERLRHSGIVNHLPSADVKAVVTEARPGRNQMRAYGRLGKFGFINSHHKLNIQFSRPGIKKLRRKPEFVRGQYWI